MTDATPTDWRDLFSLEHLVKGGTASHPQASRVPLGLHIAPSASGRHESGYRWGFGCQLWSHVDQAHIADGGAPLCQQHLERLIARCQKRGAALSSPGPMGVWTVIVMPITDQRGGNAMLGAAVVLRPARRAIDDLASTVHAHAKIRLSDAQERGAVEQLNRAAMAVHSVLAMVQRWVNSVARLWNAELILSGSAVDAPRSPQPPVQQLDDGTLSAINHELRAPLATLQGVATTLRSEPHMSLEERTDFLDILERDAARVGVLVDDALVAIRLAGQPSRLKGRPVPLSQEISTQVSVLTSRNRALAGVIEQRGPRDMWVFADPRFLGHLVRNLVVNMVDFIAGQGTVSASCRAGEDGTVALTVAGHGVRISVAEAHAAFEHIERKRGANRQIVGGGLGLFIAKTIIDAHGWGLEVTHPNPDELSLTVSMPLASPHALN